MGSDASTEVVISQRSAAILREYHDIFERRFNIGHKASYDIGAHGKALFAAEYTANGGDAYTRSVVLPIRNAFYNAGQIDARWAFLSKMRIEEPVLDYGCGVGFMLLWMERIGYRRLYGYELPGVQHDVMAEAFKAHGVAQWAPDEPVETILCINVLEHVPDPVGKLHYLKSLAKRVIANVCMDDDSPHVAKPESLERCAKLLKGWGTLYG